MEGMFSFIVLVVLLCGVHALWVSVRDAGKSDAEREKGGYAEGIGYLVIFLVVMYFIVELHKWSLS